MLFWTIFKGKRGRGRWTKFEFMWLKNYSLYFCPQGCQKPVIQIWGRNRPQVMVFLGLRNSTEGGSGKSHCSTGRKMLTGYCGSSVRQNSPSRQRCSAGASSSKRMWKRKGFEYLGGKEQFLPWNLMTEVLLLNVSKLFKKPAHPQMPGQREETVPRGRASGYGKRKVPRAEINL